MHNIHWYKILIFTGLFILSANSLEGQVKPKGNYNYWDFQKKPFYFGLTMGTHSSGYLVDKSREFNQSDSIRIINGLDKPGLNVNIIANLKIGQYFDFRFIPGFAFSERRLEFLSENGSLSQKKIESVFLEIPLLLRFKSEPYKDKRLFVIGGLKYSYDVDSNSSVRVEQAQDLIQIAPHDFQFEIGAGVQFFFPFFIFSPEIKFSQGIGNIHVFNGQLEESTLIDKIISRAISISFHFEG
ncbi:MAG: PorT family protein [Saprospiraceae bacterium]|nr:PorT family protein [Saprospiraceae bacterium]